MDIPVEGFPAAQPAAVGQRQVMSRSDILERYRHLRAIGTEHQTGALKFVAHSTFLEQARRLGLAVGRTLVADNDSEITLVFDLAIHTAKDGRSRAIDRYAKALSPPAGSDAARMLDAMRRTRFSIWQIRRRHDAAGLVVIDMLREDEVWLLDKGLEGSGRDGMLFASRFCLIDGFAMTCGVVVPVTEGIADDVLTDALAWHHSDLSTVAQDPRFATAIYRAALHEGVMDGVVYA